MGDDATLLYDDALPPSTREICESHGKKKGGPWEFYHADNFFGWEAERVVVVTAGFSFLEMATRAKRELILILFNWEVQVKKYIKAAANSGLVDLEVVEKRIENTSNTATEDVHSDN